MRRIYAATWLLALASFAAAPAWAATNQLTMSGAASGSQPSISANGVDSNISIILTTKGTGGVGIGTTSPANALGVNGAAAFGTYAGTASGASNGIIVSGNVGIGTTSPAATLDVNGTGIHIASGGSVGSAVLWNNGGILTWNSTALTVGGSVTASGATGYVPYFTSTTTLGDSVIFQTGSEVGIGTATPATTLSVYNGGQSATLTNFTQSLTNAGLNIMSGYTAGAYTPGVFWSSGNNNATLPKAGIWTETSSSGSYLNFGTSNSYSTGITNQAMIIDYSGNVGIGSASPAGILDVEGGTAAASTSGTNINIVAQSAAGNNSYPYNGGGVTISGGTGGAGGSISLLGGAGNHGAGGSVNITAGAGGANCCADTGGNVVLTSGAAGASGNPGAVIISNAANPVNEGLLKLLPNNSSAYYSFWIGFAPTGDGSDGYDRARVGAYVNLGGGTDLYFTTGTIGSLTEVMRINQFANVGIGTPSPNGKLDVYGGHLLVSRGGTAPTIGSCGTSPTITGTDNSFKVTMGSGALTSCVINFGTTWTSAPNACSLTPANATAAATGTSGAYVSAISTTQVTITGTNLTSAAYYIECM